MATADDVIADLRARLLTMERTRLTIDVAIPAGTVQDYVGATAPTGWALLDGSTLTGAQTLYPALWAVAPAGWKSGANLVLPDARGRVAVAKAASGTFATLGGTGGVETVAIGTTNLPPHSHDMTHGHGASAVAAANHSHDMTHTHTSEIRGTVGSFVNNTTGLYHQGGSGVATTFGTSNNTIGQSVTTVGLNGGHGHTITVDSQTTTATGNGPGASTALTNLQPYIVLNRIIKTH